MRNIEKSARHFQRYYCLKGRQIFNFQWEVDFREHIVPRLYLLFDKCQNSTALVHVTMLMAISSGFLE